MATRILRPEDQDVLHRLIELKGSGSASLIGREQAERLIRLGLVERFPGTYRLTLKGQVEGVRQRLNALPPFLHWLKKQPQDRPSHLPGD